MRFTHDLALTYCTAGAALLDRTDPAWPSRIDLQIFAIDDCDACVLGQLFGGYGEGITLLFSLSAPYDVTVTHGFDIPTPNYLGDYQLAHADAVHILRDVWVELIAARQAAFAELATV